MRLVTLAFGTRLCPTPRLSRRTRAFPLTGLGELEPRTLLSRQAVAMATSQLRFALGQSGYYPQPVLVARPSGPGSADAPWSRARVYQYGPDPDQQLWVLVPPDPNGRLDLMVHPGGLSGGEPTDVGLFAQLDLQRGTTVVSIGYRKLDRWPWPVPVTDIARGIDYGYRIAQNLTGQRITDVTEMGFSAGGSALVLINYSKSYPTTKIRPNRLITVSAPLDRKDVSPAKPSTGFRYTSALEWGRNIPKAAIPITLMGTHGDPVALENGRVSNIRTFSKYLARFGVPFQVYYDPYTFGSHGSIGQDLMYPEIQSALAGAQYFNG